VSVPQALLAAWLEVGQALDGLLQSGLDVEPAGGSTAAWDATCARWKVARLGEDARFAAAREAKQTRGAPRPEFLACLAAVTAASEATVKAAGAGLTAAQAAAALGTLRTFLDGARAHFEAKSTERAKKMFGHAMKAAKEHRYDVAWRPHALSCRTCGAPRVSDGFTCAFCGGPLDDAQNLHVK